jgi:exodeoxyribonuclease VII large subunit
MVGAGGRSGGGSSWPPDRGWPITDRAPATPPPAPSSRPPGPSLFDEHTPGASPTSAVGVSSLTQLTKDVLEGTIHALWVRGEVSDFKAHRSGHWYFNLRDPSAQLRCVVWSGDQRRIPAPPDDGMAVLAFGQITVYPARGDMQLRITALETGGDGLRRKAVERVLNALKRDGLLAVDRKRPLPRFPRCLAVVTSPDGAALHDIVAVARRRAPSLRIVVIPARVQGEGAPEELCAALDRLRRWGKADVVIVGRGGGAKEDLGAFNNERVARALAACQAPTVSAVGHEIDTTLCDLVADHRAATPSAAAEAAVPLMASEEQLVRALAARLVRVTRRRINSAEAGLSAAAFSTRRAATRIIERRRAEVAALANHVQTLSPLATLARGFAVARAPDGRTLTTAGDFVPGIGFELVIRDGIIAAVTSEVRPPRWPIAGLHDAALEDQERLPASGDEL